MKKKSGYFEGTDYIVTWAFGHLFTLADVEDYQGLANQNVRWDIKRLPCFPEKFIFKLKRDPKTKQEDIGVKRQFEVIKTLCNRKDVDTVINAGDSDREGEIIVRICVDKALTDKKIFKRLWLPDQTTETINSALSDMKDETEYESLAREGFARTYVDWLYGVNLTRFATLKTGTLLRVGRVIVPIVKAIYDRDMKIRNFVPEKYYVPVSNELTNDCKIELISKNKFDKNSLSEAEELCNRYNQSKATVRSKKVKKDVLAPGKLYSLTKLQNVLGKKYKMSMDNSLDILQSLYERGFVTYPRTNSEYLAEAEQDKIKTIIGNVRKLGYPVEFKHKKTIFDDKKIESHSALTPTYKIPSKEQLTEDEYRVYSTVMRRFAAVFCEKDCVIEKTEIVVDVGGAEDFVLRGTVIVEKGWTKYDDYNKKDKILPKLEKGDEVNINFKPVEKETTPPKHYTIETLNNYLKNPFKEDKASKDNSDDEEYRAIFEGLELGTEATRTGIIENAIKSQYISLKKDMYYVLPAGEYLINSLDRMGIIMDKYKTSELGRALKRVFRNEITIDECVEITRNEIVSVFNPVSKDVTLDTEDGFIGDVLGKCPLCGKNVVRKKFGYGCSGYTDGCKFAVSGTICGRVISSSNIKLLLEKGETSKIVGFVSQKSGKNFDAILKFDGEKVVFKF